MASLAMIRSRRIALAGLGLGLLSCVHLDANPFQSDYVVDADTGIEFPRRVYVPGQFKSGPLELVGLGVRTVSFIGIQVYSIGFYADLTSPTLKLTPSMSSDEKIEHIIRNSAVLLRLIPTRSTSYTHLRDAFMRALNARLQEAQKSGTLTQDDALAVAGPMRALKTLFPNTPLAKHASLDLYVPAPVLGQPRPLIVRDLGSVVNNFVSTELVLHYFTGNSPSPKLKKSTVERLESV
ncbi:p-loop containing nucleoside triphosphate hydrolase protein [Favolaschia claudopus]|uniref:P-loop containing nucleoside triphosphate hydrolase protein n=1 Tax=Favolaschia claudopus TaxID=2862362 RepID=A0AAW0EKF4_9AGAR